MLLACDNLKTAKYTLRKKERTGDHLFESEVIVKLQVKPYKTYIYSVKPNPGAEAIYVAGENGGNVVVSPNKFPYVTLRLSPYGSLLRDNQHHTSLDMGFTYIATIMKALIKNDPAGFYSMLSYDGEIELNKRRVYALTFDNKKFGFVSYTVQKGETITSIATRMCVSDYMILKMNPQCSDYEDVTPGQTILVPNAYAKKMTLYVDKLYNLPLSQVIYDDKGLYEQYELVSFIPNPPLKPEEFTETYSEYKF